MIAILQLIAWTLIITWLIAAGCAVVLLTAVAIWAMLIQQSMDEDVELQCSCWSEESYGTVPKEMIVTDGLEGVYRQRGMNVFSDDVDGHYYIYIWRPGDYPHAIEAICNDADDPDTNLTQEMASEWMQQVQCIERESVARINQRIGREVA